MKNILTISLLIVLLLLFGIFVHFSKVSHEVIEVLSPSKFVIDMNDNKIKDTDEIFCIDGIESFSLESNDKFIEKYTKRFKINYDDIINLGYLGTEFSRKNLLNKKVKIKLSNKETSECIYAKIKINGTDYSKILYKSAFGIKNDNIGNNAKFKQNLIDGRKLELVILNHHSNKYHKTNCKFAKLAHDKIYIPLKQLPKDMKPCRYCHDLNKKLKNKLNKSKYSNEIYVSYLHSPLNISDCDIQIYMVDFPKHLKPNTYCSTAICNKVLSLINSANSSIDIAIYGYDDIPAITAALKNAKNRGVKIRFIFDETPNPLNTYYKGNSLISEIADKYQSDRTGVHAQKLMHNKFIIFDNKVVLTGSMNFSRTGLSDYDGNDVAIIKSNEVAKLYTSEFEQMLNKKFHNDKSKNKYNNRFLLGNSELEVYFSPQDKTSLRIIQLINNSNKYIYIPAFLITHTNIANALINAYKRGVDVKIILDANSASTRNTKHQHLRNSGIPLKFENYAGKLHSKTILIDDEYLIMGSMNFSNSGENKNDENVIIIKNSEFVKSYKEFFIYLWNLIPDKYSKLTIKAEGKYSIGSCSDGIDNNFDGKIDSDDSGCK